MDYLLIVSGISLAILGLLLWRAPRGWQDDQGFHLGDVPAEPGEAPQGTAPRGPAHG